MALFFLNGVYQDQKTSFRKVFNINRKIYFFATQSCSADLWALFCFGKCNFLGPSRVDHFNQDDSGHFSTIFGRNQILTRNSVEIQRCNFVSYWEMLESMKRIEEIVWTLR